MQNSAERLLKILQEGENHDNGKSCRQVWQELLRVQNDDEALLISRLGKTMLLPYEIALIIDEHFPEERETHKYWINRVSTAFKQQNLDQKWETFNKIIDQHTISYLRISANLLSVLTGSSDLGEDKLSDLRESINNLLVDVRDSDITANAKVYLLRSLQRILIALDEYEISGSMPIIDAIEMTYGHAVADPDFRSSICESKIGEKVWSTLSMAANVVTVAGVPLLASDISGFINALPKL
ncbi:MAG: hypothetical protein V3V18_03320 [Methylococcales bacterium]